jgi:hypothetical protein
MAKTKETPWTEQKLMYKDGNVDVYRKFNWETWKRMTADERAMWTELNENTPAPISKEVIEFNNKAAKQFENDNMPFAAIAPTPKVGTGDGGVLDIVEAEKEELKAKLKELGIRFTHNSKLATLKKKLANADNPE